MQMRQVSASSFSVLFDTNVQTERVPEPFRLQEGLVLGIPYSEYISYVHSLSQDSAIELYPSTRYVLNQMSAQSINNYRCYLMNVAYAICKELHFASIYSSQPTLIIPTSDADISLNWRTYVERTKSTWQSHARVREVAEGYNLTIKPITGLAQSAMELASCLFEVARRVEVEGAINMTV